MVKMPVSNQHGINLSGVNTHSMELSQRADAHIYHYFGIAYFD
jgi:hypothetical protein